MTKIKSSNFKILFITALVFNSTRNIQNFKSSIPSDEYLNIQVECSHHSQHYHIADVAGCQVNERSKIVTTDKFYAKQQILVCTQVAFLHS